MDDCAFEFPFSFSLLIILAWFQEEKVEEDNGQKQAEKEGSPEDDLDDILMAELENSGSDSDPEESIKATRIEPSKIPPDIHPEGEGRNAMKKEEEVQSQSQDPEFVENKKSSDMSKKQNSNSDRRHLEIGHQKPGPIVPPKPKFSTALRKKVSENWTADEKLSPEIESLTAMATAYAKNAQRKIQPMTSKTGENLTKRKASDQGEKKLENGSRKEDLQVSPKKSKQDFKDTTIPSDEIPEDWHVLAASRRHKNQREYQETDLLSPTCPIYDPEIDRAIREQSVRAKKLVDEDHLLSGLTKQQHKWYMSNIGRSFSLLN